MHFEDNTNSSSATIQQTIEALEAQRSILGDQTVEIALSALREKLAILNARQQTSHEPQERKLITVLFADVSGFTAMAETLDHEVVSSVINSLWSRVDKAILAHGGRIDKHIGDAVMALFGTPTAREDDPERAIRAAAPAKRSSPGRSQSPRPASRWTALPFSAERRAHRRRPSRGRR